MRVHPSLGSPLIHKRPGYKSHFEISDPLPYPTEGHSSVYRLVTAARYHKSLCKPQYSCFRYLDSMERRFHPVCLFRVPVQQQKWGKSVKILQELIIVFIYRDFSNTETLCSEQKYYCETCCSKQEAQKR